MANQRTNHKHVAKLGCNEAFDGNGVVHTQAFALIYSVLCLTNEDSQQDELARFWAYEVTGPSTGGDLYTDMALMLSREALIKATASGLLPPSERRAGGLK